MSKYSQWRDTRVTIIVESDGEEPLTLTTIYPDLHLSEPQTAIYDMAEAFRCYRGGVEESRKIKNKPYMVNVSRIVKGKSRIEK